MKPCNSCELRSSTMWRCDCIKRNGLQDRCMLIDCLGRPECMTKLYPICGPGKKALLNLTDLGDAEVALKKFYSANKAREAALAAYCRLKCQSTPSPCLAPSGPGPASPNYLSSYPPSPNCPSTNPPPPNCLNSSARNYPSSNSPPPNCPSNNFRSPNCPSSNSPSTNYPSANFPSSNFPSPNFPSSNCSSSNSPSPNGPRVSFIANPGCPTVSYSTNSNIPHPSYPSNANQYPYRSNPSYPPASYSQSHSCPPPFNSLPPGYQSSAPQASYPASSSRPLSSYCQSPKPQTQSCPQQQNQNFSLTPQTYVTCTSH